MNMLQAEKALNGLVGALCNYTPNGQLKNELEEVKSYLKECATPIKVSDVKTELENK